MRRILELSGLAEVRCTRRRWLQVMLASGAGLSGVRFASAGETPTAPRVERRVTLVNTHTAEIASVVYRVGQEYDRKALAELAHLLRDHRNGEAHPIDPALFEQLTDLAAAADREPRYEVISGYRSPETNARMATPGSGVAKRSLHMQGRAIDVRLVKCDCDDLRDLAIEAACGGVGYYKRSDFVHLDTGAHRSWIG